MSLLLITLLGCGAGPERAESGEADPPVLLSDHERVFTGGYADPSVVIHDGSWWMYLNQDGAEGSGTTVYRSADGIAWSAAAGLILDQVATARAVNMDGGVRLYYPAREAEDTAGYKVIYSAFSEDAVLFAEEPGVRWRASDGDAGGPALLAGPDGSWRAWFHVSNPGEADPAVERAWIGAASSLAGAAWTVEAEPALSGEADVEGVDPEAQVLHPFVLEHAGLQWMFYNAHAQLFTAVSSDGERWQKLGALGVEGADLCVAEHEGGLRAWYGRYSDVTSGEIWTARLTLSADSALARLDEG